MDRCYETNMKENPTTNEISNCKECEFFEHNTYCGYDRKPGQEHYISLTSGDHEWLPTICRYATPKKPPEPGEPGENHICKTTKTCSAGIICPNCGEDYDSTTIHICPPDAAEKLAEMIRPQIPGRFYNESGKYRDARAEYEDRVLRPTAAAIREAIDEQTYDLHHARNCLEDDLKKLTARVKRLEKQMVTHGYVICEFESEAEND